jgi:hypothetical protein
MNRQQHRFIIGGHVVEICFSTNDSNDMTLLPSFTPFVTDSNETPLLTLTVDDRVRPAEGRRKLRTFDTGNGDTVVYLLPDGGYQFIIRDTRDRDCCLLLSNADFSQCRCALNGDRQMRTFGLNDALMLAYAFAGSFHHTLLIHASCIAYGDWGYPFLAKSGTGKSTHSALWMNHIEGAELLNDDNPVVRIIDNTPYIYGSPWSGKTPCYRQQRRLLGAMVQIDRAPANSIERLATVQAFATLLPACSTMTWDRTIYSNLCDTLNSLIGSTPVYTLHCLPDKEAALLCHKTIQR